MPMTAPGSPPRSPHGTQSRPRSTPSGRATNDVPAEARYRPWRSAQWQLSVRMVIRYGSKHSSGILSACAVTERTSIRSRSRTDSSMGVWSSCWPSSRARRRNCSSCRLPRSGVQPAEGRGATHCLPVIPCLSQICHLLSKGGNASRLRRQ